MQLAVRARSLLPRGESMQDWCRQHCTPSEWKALEEAGVFHEFLASSTYEDNVFQYMHVHIPKSMASRKLEVRRKERQLLSQHEWRILLGDQGKLVSGSGWEHYAWHNPEPHILLLRRPHSQPVVNTPPAEKKVAVLESTPTLGSVSSEALESTLVSVSSEAGTATPVSLARGAAGLAPSAAGMAGGAGEPAVSAAGAAGVAELAVSAAGAAGAAEPAVSAADAAGGVAEPAVSAACTAGGERSTLSWCQGVPLDVRLAAKGLSVKLFPHQVPELMAIMQGIQEIYVLVKDLPVQICTTALTRAAVILRGIRGEAGVVWARQQILLDTWGCKHTLCEVPACQSKHAWLHSEGQIFWRLGRELVQAHGRVEAKSAAWASHREKRHAKYSGAHFLKALQTPEGSRGAARLSFRLRSLMLKCLKVNPHPWTDCDTRELLECSLGNLPLCVENGNLKLAGWYNSVNAGFTWLIWAQVHGFIPHIPFGDATFAVALLGQSSLAKEQLKNAGSGWKIAGSRQQGRGGRRVR